MSILILSRRKVISTTQFYWQFRPIAPMMCILQIFKCKSVTQSKTSILWQCTTVFMPYALNPNVWPLYSLEPYVKFNFLRAQMGAYRVFPRCTSFTSSYPFSCPLCTSLLTSAQTPLPPTTLPDWYFPWTHTALPTDRPGMWPIVLHTKACKHNETNRNNIPTSVNTALTYNSNSQLSIQLDHCRVPDKRNVCCQCDNVLMSNDVIAFSARLVGILPELRPFHRKSFSALLFCPGAQ